MPLKIRSSCSVPSCPDPAVRGGRCADHAGRSPYNYRWQQRAKRFLARYPLCGMRPRGLTAVMSQCADLGRITIAVQVDHVRPHRGDPALFNDELENWQALCANCGARKSAMGF